jgi:peptidylglycine monooxygenase / peptidylamidoglycolate lyase
LEQVWALGEKLVPGSDQAHFCKPAGVAVSKRDGSVYIADGYCNNRILHFSKDGKFLHEWGHSSNDPTSQMNTYALGSFFLPHDVTLDDASGRVYVADRQNGRVQAFTEKGEPLYEIRNLKYFVDVYSVHFCPGTFL